MNFWFFWFKPKEQKNHAWFWRKPQQVLRKTTLGFWENKGRFLTKPAFVLFNYKYSSTLFLLKALGFYAVQYALAGAVVYPCGLYQALVKIFLGGRSAAAERWVESAQLV